MTTATLEPHSVDSIDLITHSFNPDGDCLDPERVQVKMPKGCTCELRLAHCEGWHIGYQLAAGKEGAVDVYPSLNVIGYPTRALALDAALRVAVDFFAASPKSKLHKKCAGEVHAFTLALGGGSPANKPAARVPLPEPRLMEIEVARLEANPHNPRGAVDLEAPDIADLAGTIAEVGLLQPIGVRILSDDQGLPGIGENRLQLLWGHRRLAAFLRLKRDTITARVYEGITDEQARLLLLIENGQQKQLDPIQEARGYAEMVRDFELTQDDVAKVVKKSRPVVANALRLLELPERAQKLISQGQLTTAHGTALCRFKAWPAACDMIALACVRSNLSTSAIENELDDNAITDTLETEGLAVHVRSYEFPSGRLPEKFMNDPDFLKSGSYSYWCFAPEKWKAYKTARDAARKEEEAKQRKQMSTTRTADTGMPIEKERAYLAELLAEDKIGKKGGKLVCTDTRAWQTICQTAQEFRNEADGKRMRELAVDAMAVLKKTKAITGPLAAILFFDDEFDFYPGGSSFRNLDGKLAKELGLKFAAGKIINDRLLASDPTALLKLQIGARLDNSTYMSAESIRILANVLGLDKPGLIEETPEGRAQIVASVRKKLKLPDPSASKSEAVQTSAKKGGKKK